jgi:hypothetical protein
MATRSASAETLGDRIEHAIEARTDVASEIERGERRKPRRLGRTVFWLAVTGVSIYFVFPSVVEVFGSWREITRFSPASLAAMAGLQCASLACLWALQFVALHDPADPGQRAVGRDQQGARRGRQHEHREPDQRRVA